MYSFIVRNQDNMGGNQTFWFIEEDQVLSIPRNENGIILEHIQLAADRFFYRGYSTINTLSITDDPVDGDHGQSFPHVIKGVTPKDTPEMVHLFRQMMRKRFIVIIKDYNGFYKVYGQKIAGQNGRGLFFRYQTLKDGPTNTFNGYEFEFYRTYDDPAWFYSGNIIEDQTVIIPPPYDEPVFGLPVTQVYGLQPQQVLYGKEDGTLGQSEYFKWDPDIFRLSIGNDVYEGTLPSGMNFNYFRPVGTLMQGAISWNMYWNGGYVRQTTELTAVRFAANVATSNANTGIFVTHMNLAGSDHTAFSTNMNAAGSQAYLHANHRLGIGAGDSSSFDPGASLEIRGFSTSASDFAIWVKDGAVSPVDIFKLAYDGTLIFKGPLGINTATAARPLHVKAVTGSDVARFEAENGQAIVMVYNNNGGVDSTNGTTAGRWDFAARYNSTSGSEIANIIGVYTGNGTTRFGDLAFRTANNAGPAERMRILASGALRLASAVGNAISFTYTSGSPVHFLINSSFAPTSGTATWAALQLTQAINQTGGANGITRGLYINTTITAAAEHRAIETTSGRIYFGGTSVHAGVVLHRLTTAQRNALTNLVAGTVIYNSSTNKHQGYDGTTWNDLY